MARVKLRQHATRPLRHNQLEPPMTRHDETPSKTKTAINNDTNSKGMGVLAVWTDARAEQDAAFNDWYNRDHLPERTGHPGFLNGRRYKAISGSPRYLALYDTESPAALSTKIYRNALENPSAWTRRIMPSFHNFTRSVFQIETRVGAGQAGVVATIRPTNDRPAPTTFGAWLTDTALPALAACDGVVSAEYLTTPDGDSQTRADSTTEGALRTVPDSIAPWAIIIGATEPGLLRAALSTALPRKILAEHAGGGVKIGTYRLLYAL
jgi:hypothetical protein